MLSFFAAVSAPLRIKSQNESPGTSWVIIAIVTRGVSAAVPPPIPPPFSWGLPPVDEHDASKLITAVAATIVAAPRGRRRVDESGGQFVYFIAFLVFLLRRDGVADGNISRVDGDCLWVWLAWGHAGCGAEHSDAQSGHGMRLRR